MPPNNEVDSGSTHERRAFLERVAATGGIVGLTALAGCLGGDEDPDPDDDPDDADDDVADDDDTSDPADEAELGEQLGPFKYFNNPEDYNPARHDAINLTADAISDAGIDVEVETMEWGTLFDRIYSQHDFDFGTWHHPMGIDPTRVLTDTFHSDNAETGQPNYPGFENDRADELLDAQIDAESMDARIDALHEFQEIIAEEVPLHPLVDMVNSIPYNNEQVSGWIEHIQGPPSLYNMVNIKVDNPEGQLRGSWSETLENLNVFAPWMSKQRHQYWVLYDYLVQLDPDLEPAWDLSLATGVERPDSQSIVVELRDHVFHDGEPVTAEDVAFSYNVLVDREPPVQSHVQPIIDEATVIDDSTVRIDFTQDVGVIVHPFVTTQVPIVPKHVWEDEESISQTSVDEPVGSGVMEFDYWDRGAELSLTAFEDHWVDLGFDQRIWRIIPEISTNWELLERGDLNYLPFGRIGREMYEAQQQEVIDVKNMAGNSWWKISMNTRNPGLDETAVRQAVAHALPKTPIVEQMLYGFPEVGKSIVPQGFGPLHNPDVKEYAEDVDVARQRLADADFVFDDEGMAHYPAE